MLATQGFDWVRPSSLPDTASPIYPDRPIRPLPKRRIRARLSPDQTESISFPPIPPSSSPLFGSPQSPSERSFIAPHYSGNVDVLHDEHEHEHVCDCGREHSDLESDEEEERTKIKAGTQRSSWPGRKMRIPRDHADRVAIRTKPPPPKSSASSADGYESFENTNNKKKRKIPISGASGAGSSLDGTSMSLPTQSVDVSMPEDRSTSGSHYYTAVGASHADGSGIGISGAGRGRHSKTSSRMMGERKPLASSSNGANSLPTSSPTDRQGIISAAIASATENGQAVASKGQENISLLQRQQTGSSVPKDFTFECPSDSANKIGLSSRTAQLSPSPGVPTRGMAPGPLHSPNGLRQSNGYQSSHPALPLASSHEAPLPKTKPRRQGQSLRAAAQERRAQKAYDNYHNPPKREDVWICDFCEYEAIFGRPPYALIRQYELKDRNSRNKQEAQRRNLEKLKAKGRKNRKGARGGAKNTGATSADLLPPQSSHYDPQYDPPLDVDSQGEEYFDDEEYDEAEPLPPDLDPLVNGAFGSIEGGHIPLGPD